MAAAAAVVVAVRVLAAVAVGGDCGAEGSEGSNVQPVAAALRLDEDVVAVVVDGVLVVVAPAVGTTSSSPRMAAEIAGADVPVVAVPVVVGVRVRVRVVAAPAGGAATETPVAFQEFGGDPCCQPPLSLTLTIVRGRSGAGTRFGNGAREEEQSRRVASLHGLPPTSNTAQSVRADAGAPTNHSRSNRGEHRALAADPAPFSTPTDVRFRVASDMETSTWYYS